MMRVSGEPLHVLAKVGGVGEGAEFSFPLPFGARGLSRESKDGGGIGVVTLDTHLNTVVTTQPPADVSPGVGFGFTAEVKDSSGAVDTNFNGDGPGAGNNVDTLVWIPCML